MIVDGQAEIRGLVIGDHTPYPWLGEGPDWWSKPTVRASDIPRPRESGAIATLDLSDPMTLVLTVGIVADSPADFVAKRDALAEAWSTRNEDVELVFQWGGEARVRVGRTRNMSVTAADVAVGDFAVAQLQFVANDPLIYSAEEFSGSTGVGSVVGGLEFPLSFPLAFGTATPGTFNAVNSGTAEAPWTATLTGPLVSPKILHVGKQQALEFNGFTLAAGQTLVFDQAMRTVLLNGTASRSGALTRREWWTLSPGNNLIQLDAASGSGQLTLTWRSAWQ